MLSSASISAIRDEATENARKRDLRPTLLTPEAVESWPPFPFPFLGDYVPEGWRIARDARDEWLTLFVDKTGWGDEDEPALSVSQLIERLRTLANSEDTWGVGIIEEGQFQVVLGLYKPDYGDFTRSGLLTDQERKDVLAGTPYGKNTQKGGE